MYRKYPIISQVLAGSRNPLIKVAVHEGLPDNQFGGKVVDLQIPADKICDEAYTDAVLKQRGMIPADAILTNGDGDYLSYAYWWETGPKEILFFFVMADEDESLYESWLRQEDKEGWEEGLVQV
jgi:hypothetical protein